MNRNIEVFRIMTRNPITVKATDTVNTIKDIFEKNRISHLPVVDDHDALIGIISKEDFLREAYGLSIQTTGKTYSQKWYGGIKISEVMTGCPIDLTPEDTVGLAADLFLANDFHSIPITEKGKLIGIVTTQDLIRYAFQNQLVSK